MKHLKYLKYVLRHKWLVFLECCKFGMPLVGLVHDLSKFSPAEWNAYVNTFYGSEDDKQLWKRRFRYAWLNHQRKNPHHWNYWVLDGEPLRIPERYLKEMIADWTAMSRAQGKNSPIEWYNANKEKIQLHLSTKMQVESFLITGNRKYLD